MSLLHKPIELRSMIVSDKIQTTLVDDQNSTKVTVNGVCIFNFISFTILLLFVRVLWSCYGLGWKHIKGLLENCHISLSNALEIQQFSMKPLIFQPLPCWIYFRKHRYICIFVSFLKTEMAQVVEILSHGRQGFVFAGLSISWLLMPWRRKEPWCPGDARSQGISSYGIEVTQLS